MERDHGISVLEAQELLLWVPLVCDSVLGTSVWQPSLSSSRVHGKQRELPGDGHSATSA